MLIDDDLVLTAGHCIERHTPCDSYAYVFNYQLDRADLLARDPRRGRLLAALGSFLRVAPGRGEYTPDFAVIQLDRPVEGAHVAALLRPTTAARPARVAGHDRFRKRLARQNRRGGLGRLTRARSDSTIFVANVDAFQGHSGSATFDSENRLAGILIGGRAPDYVTLAGETCSRVSVYEDVQAGEVVHNIAPIVSALCADSGDGEDLCGPKACEGSPCGVILPPSLDPGITSPPSSGCSVSVGSSGPIAGWLTLLLFAAARRFRRRAA